MLTIMIKKQPSPTIFDKLSTQEIEVDANLKYFPHRATFDFECYFEKPTHNSKEGKFKIEAHHVPLSVSIASNVDGYENVRHFITDGNSQ